jgi:hypothetical protein
LRKNCRDGSFGKSHALQARVEQLLAMHSVLEARGGTKDIRLEQGDLNDQVRDDGVQFGAMEPGEIDKDLIDRLPLVCLVHFGPFVIQEIED